MSDDYGFDDAFDDSFLREVDNITAVASTSAAAAAGQTKNIARTTSHPVTSFNKGWTAAQRSVSAASGSSSRAEARRLALLGLSSKPPSQGLGFKPIPKNAVASSSRALHPPAASGSRLGRTSSGPTGVQTHLNFRRENQTTKGKIWDRTAFAATGRKKVIKNKDALEAQKKRKRGEAFDDEEDEMDEEEDDWGEPLAPDPKSKVDLSYEPPKHHPDLEATKTYIYPTNRPKRDYQFDIVMACFTDNCLVALPTGLGKTFVAGVVMLNFYRWFPTGKIVFLAPTKPLVNQQIEACQMTCGIPSKDAAVMTGSSVSAKERVKLWQERRVFYCTPQTMYNDLTTGRLDPRDIVLAVFDEAHKASGSYAYTTILAYLTAHQPHFRVLALTATPGADVPKVQGVVDALHISRIEIREAEDPAISKYMNEKHTEQHVVPMSDVIEGFRDRWAVLMRPMVQKLVDKGVLMDRDLDTKRLKPFRLTAKRMEISRDRTSGVRWALGSLQSLEQMARAMTHLLEFSLGMFRATLLEIAGNTSQETGKKVGSKGNSNSLRNNLEFQKLLRDVEAEMNLMRIGAGGRGRSDAHPKMGKTLELLLAHFTQAAEDEKVHGIKNDTRAMVFCSFRHCVLEVVDMLNDHPALLKATKFVGQSQGKQENDKGFNQKEQKKTIVDFKEGKHNILVSTSIGEEGLDIGEVDFVIIYDMPKQSIKLLQRIGRTGRKRSGQVHVLMSGNREDLNWDSAQQTHREIQEEILHSRNLELFEDVERLLPVGPFPKCEEKEMPVDPWDPEDQKRKIVATPKSKTKAKDKEAGAGAVQRGDAIPEGAANGFRSVAELLREQGKPKRKGASPVRSESGGDDDVVEDEELLYGPKVAKGKKGKAVVEEDEEAAEPKEDPTDPKVIRRKKDEEERKRQESIDRIGLDFFHPSGPLRNGPRLPDLTPPSSPSPSPVRKRATHPPGSPDSDSEPHMQAHKLRGMGRLSPATAALVGFSQIDPIDLSWNDSDEEDETLVPSAPPRRIGLSKSRPASQVVTKATPLGPSRSTLDMPPPPIPAHRSSSPAGPRSVPTPGIEATQFLVRRPVARRARIFETSSDKEAKSGPVDEDAVSSPFLPLRGGAARVATVSSDPASSPVVPRRPRPKGKGKVPKAQVQQYFDVDVEISGTDSADEPSQDEETESDRKFAGKDFAPTQAPKGYNQRAVYLAGLSTQAGSKAGLGVNPRGNPEGFLAKARRPVLVTDDERNSENEYELGSFVVQDDEDLGFDACE
ncbi:uncharacterized protein MKK02DRAFT_18316 [Dioszegia hungarica]|uniref:ATP-dependent DNA helicase n=1 Tax=Dioszegia hungarica TaxID=4972 RepID=A0AA38H5Z8_9TREE|nr:uncharacterized protein MKK02DRAFT_18316 [Dioszegia hungarica]KAI9633416.1 hypothetical protein MKK02DRAFT_18316 [Dioszegia hungarica]